MPGYLCKICRKDGENPNGGEILRFDSKKDDNGIKTIYIHEACAIENNVVTREEIERYRNNLARLASL